LRPAGLRKSASSGVFVAPATVMVEPVSSDACWGVSVAVMSRRAVLGALSSAAPSWFVTLFVPWRIERSTLTSMVPLGMGATPPGPPAAALTTTPCAEPAIVVCTRVASMLPAFVVSGVVSDVLEACRPAPFAPPDRIELSTSSDLATALVPAERIESALAAPLAANAPTRVSRLGTPRALPVRAIASRWRAPAPTRPSTITSDDPSPPRTAGAERSAAPPLGSLRTMTPLSVAVPETVSATS
jgi:hypothetical protein